MPGYLYVVDATELATRGAETTLTDAQALVTTYALEAKTAYEALETANKATAALKEGRAAVYTLLELERAK